MKRAKQGLTGGPVPGASASRRRLQETIPGGPLKRGSRPDSVIGSRSPSCAHARTLGMDGFDPNPVSVPVHDVSLDGSLKALGDRAPRTTRGGAA